VSAESTENRPIIAAKLTPAVLAPRLKEIMKWYQTVLNAEVVYQTGVLV